MLLLGLFVLHLIFHGIGRSGIDDENNPCEGIDDETDENIMQGQTGYTLVYNPILSDVYKDVEGNDECKIGDTKSQGEVELFFAQFIDVHGKPPCRDDGLSIFLYMIEQDTPCIFGERWTLSDAFVGNLLYFYQYRSTLVIYRWEDAKKKYSRYVRRCSG